MVPVVAEVKRLGLLHELAIIWYAADGHLP